MPKRLISAGRFRLLLSNDWASTNPWVDADRPNGERVRYLDLYTSKHELGSVFTLIIGPFSFFWATLGKEDRTLAGENSHE